MRKNTPVGRVFVIDATSWTVFMAMTDNVIDSCFDFHVTNGHVAGLVASHCVNRSSLLPWRWKWDVGFHLEFGWCWRFSQRNQWNLTREENIPNNWWALSIWHWIMSHKGMEGSLSFGSQMLAIAETSSRIKRRTNIMIRSNHLRKMCEKCHREAYALLV